MMSMTGDAFLKSYLKSLRDKELNGLEEWQRERLRSLDTQEDAQRILHAIWEEKKARMLK